MDSKDARRENTNYYYYYHSPYIFLIIGLFINVGKCEIYSRNHLEGFPEQIVKSNKACFVILGIPIGDAEFCASFISSKRVGSKLLLDKLEEVGAIDSHVALMH